MFSSFPVCHAIYVIILKLLNSQHSHIDNPRLSRCGHCGDGGMGLPTLRLLSVWAICRLPMIMVNLRRSQCGPSVGPVSAPDWLARCRHKLSVDGPGLPRLDLYMGLSVVDFDITMT